MISLYMRMHYLSMRFFHFVAFALFVCIMLYWIVIERSVIDTETYRKIDDELSTLGKTRKDMCRETGISYNTLASLYQRKSENISLNILRAIARYLNVSLDYLIFDNVEVKKYGKQKSPSPTKAEAGGDAVEAQIIKNYEALNSEGQARLCNYSEDLVSSGRYTKNNKSEVCRDA